MNSLKQIGLACLCGGLGVIASSMTAQALDFNFSYTTNEGVTTSGIFQTNQQTATKYLITGISNGIRNGSSITLLGSGEYSNGFGDFNDNVLFPDATNPNKLTFGGFAFISNSIKYSVFNNDSFANFESTNNDGMSTGGDGKLITSFNVTPAVVGVPFDFNPAEGAALGLPLFIGLGILRKRVARKSKASKAVVAVS